MIKKEYYQLDELHSKFNMTKADVKYLFDNAKLLPVFNLPLKSYVIGTVEQGRFIGYGVASYKGLVSISIPDFLELWQTGKVDVERLLLRDRAAIQNYTEHNPFHLALPTSSIYSWDSKPKPELNNKSCMALVLPEEIESIPHFFGVKLTTLASVKGIAEDLRTFAQKTAEQCNKTPTTKLKKVTESFSLKDVCVLHSTLERLGIINEPVKTSVVGKREFNPNFKFENDFHELISRILLGNKNIKTKGVIRILSEEAMRPEDSRVYDYKNILLDDVNGVYIWRDFSTKSTERRCSFNSLRNVVNEVKKNMNTFSNYSPS